MLEAAQKQELVELGKSLFSRGYCVGGAGNISVKLSDGRILITPTNVSLGRLQAENLALISAQGEHIQGSRPTKELGMHLAVYAHAPACAAIVHLHSTYATALSSLENTDAEDALQAFTPYYVMNIGQLPMIPYFKPGSDALAQAAGDMAKKAHAFLLSNHGVLVYASCLEKAVNAAEELEETIKLHFIMQATGKKVRYLSAQEKAALMPLNS